MTERKRLERAERAKEKGKLLEKQKDADNDRKVEGLNKRKDAEDRKREAERKKKERAVGSGSTTTRT